MPNRSSIAVALVPASVLFIPRIRPVTTRFSHAVSRSSRPAFSVRTPVRRRTSLPSRAGSMPSTRLDPRSGARTPFNSRTVVVLPAPFGPSTARTSPGEASSVRSTRASWPLNDRVRPSATIALAAERPTVTAPVLRPTCLRETQVQERRERLEDLDDELVYLGHRG